jgi:hypothetical protein
MLLCRFLVGFLPRGASYQASVEPLVSGANINSARRLQGPDVNVGLLAGFLPRRTSSLLSVRERERRASGVGADLDSELRLWIRIDINVGFSRVSPLRRVRAHGWC